MIPTGQDSLKTRSTLQVGDRSYAYYSLAKAAEQGRPWYNLAYAMKRALDKAYEALNVAPPTYEPAATGHVPGAYLQALAENSGIRVDQATRQDLRLPAAGRLVLREARPAAGSLAASPNSSTSPSGSVATSPPEVP